jgi:hypothetical protein
MMTVRLQRQPRWASRSLSWQKLNSKLRLFSQNKKLVAQSDIVDGQEERGAMTKQRGLMPLALSAGLTVGC